MLKQRPARQSAEKYPPGAGGTGALAGRRVPRIVLILAAAVLILAVAAVGWFFSHSAADPALGGSWRLTDFDVPPYSFLAPGWELEMYILPRIGNKAVTVTSPDGSTWTFDDAISTRGNRIEGDLPGTWSLEGDTLRIDWDDGHYEVYTRIPQ